MTQDKYLDELFGNGQPIDWTAAYRGMAEKYAAVSKDRDRLRQINAELLAACLAVDAAMPGTFRLVTLALAKAREQK